MLILPGIIKPMNRFLDYVRKQVGTYINNIARGINQLSGGKITPNMITIVGLLAHLLIGWLIADGSWRWAGLLLVVFGLFDTLDGALARLQKSSSSFGMLLDSVTDRLKEIIIYTSLAYTFIDSGNKLAMILIVLSLGISLTISYINAWSEVVAKSSPGNKAATLNKTFRSGLMTFDVRMFTLVVGLLSGYIILAIALIVILGFITAVERFIGAARKL